MGIVIKITIPEYLQQKRSPFPTSREFGWLVTITNIDNNSNDKYMNNKTNTHSKKKTYLST